MKSDLWIKFDFILFELYVLSYNSFLLEIMAKHN